MSLTPGFFFWLGFGAGLTIFPWMVLVLILHFLMPQAVLARYWKEPHFRPFELMLFNRSFAPLRTVLFMWMFTVPRAGRRRGIIEPHRLIPGWYRVVSIIMCVWVSVAIASFFATMIGLNIYAYVTGNPNTLDWKETAVLILSLGCFAFVALRQWRLNRRDDKTKRERYNDRKKKNPAKT